MWPMHSPGSAIPHTPTSSCLARCAHRLGRQRKRRTHERGQRVETVVGVLAPHGDVIGVVAHAAGQHADRRVHLL